jgi:hypothetical protein
MPGRKYKKLLPVHQLMLTKEEFEVLFGIARQGRASPDRIAGDTGMFFYESLFESLEAKGLIKVERRKGQIYGAIETSAGAAAIDDPQYADWFAELD